MFDKNGIEMKTGDVVRIENAFFKNDNGLYFVTHSPNDPSWSGSDYCLQKIRKNGKLSEAKYNLAFWPLSAYTNDRWKNAEANKHNKANATIEILSGVNRSYIAEHFSNVAISNREQEKTYKWRFGENSEVTVKTGKIAEFYENLVKEIGAY